MLSLIALSLFGCDFPRPRIDGVSLQALSASAIPEFVRLTNQGRPRLHNGDYPQEYLRIALATSYDFAQVDLRKYIPASGAFWFCGAYDQRFLSGGGDLSGIYVTDERNEILEVRNYSARVQSGQWRGGEVHPYLLFQVQRVPGEERNHREPPLPPYDLRAVPADLCIQLVGILPPEALVRSNTFRISREAIAKALAPRP